MPQGVLETIAGQHPNVGIRMAGVSGGMRAAVGHLHGRVADEVQDAFLAKMRQAHTALTKAAFARARSVTMQIKRRGKRVVGTDYVHAFGGIVTVFEVGQHQFMIDVFHHGTGINGVYEWQITGHVVAHPGGPGRTAFVLTRRPASDVVELDLVPMNTLDPAVRLGMRRAVEQYMAEMPAMVRYSR
jgi:hypothetical protein